MTVNPTGGQFDDGLRPRTRFYTALFPWPGIATNEGPVKATIPVEPVQAFLGSRIITVPPVGAVTYNDSGSGQINLSGSGSESFAVAPPPLTLQGSASDGPIRAVVSHPGAQAEGTSRIIKVPPVNFFDSGSGTLVLSGSGVESFSVKPPTWTVAGNSQNTIRAAVSYTTAVGTDLGSRIFRPPAAPITYNDSGSGTIQLSGSGVESFFVSPRLGVIVPGRSNQGGVVSGAPPFPDLQVPVSRLFGALAATNSFSDSGTGQINLSGSGIDSYSSPGPQMSVASPGGTNMNRVVRAPGVVPDFEVKEPVSQVFVFYNSAPPIYHVITPGSTNQGFYIPRYEPAAFNAPTLGTRLIKGYGSSTNNDSGSGQLVLSGTGVESQTGTGSGSGQLNLSGTRSESAVFTDSRSGQINLSGARADTHTHTSAATITLVLSGSGVEDYRPPGGAPPPSDVPHPKIGIIIR